MTRTGYLATAAALAAAIPFAAARAQAPVIETVPPGALHGAGAVASGPSASAAGATAHGIAGATGFGGAGGAGGAGGEGGRGGAGGAATGVGGDVSSRGGEATARAAGGQSSASGGTVNNNVSVAGGAGGGGQLGGTVTLRNVPSMALGLSNAYCGNAMGAGAAGAGFGFQISIGTHDLDCKRQNYAVILAGLGLREEAIYVLAQNRDVNAALHLAAERRQQREAVATPTAPLPVPAPRLRPDAPAFCSVPGLALGAYPECVGG